jgi:hypothetical protein
MPSEEKPMTDQPIPGGAFMVARKIFNSAIWSKPPLFLKVWLWILGQASYADHITKGQNYRRGEFLTTREKIIKANGYRQNRQVIFPTLKQIRDILAWLVTEGMITVTPIRERDLADPKLDELGRASNNHFGYLGDPKNPKMQGPERLGRTRADTMSRTWAYLGILISVVNYESYQTLDAYTRADTRADHSDELGPVHKKGSEERKENPASLPSFSSLRERYPDQNLLDRTLQAIASTRRSGRVADSVLLAQLQKWERYPAAQVEAGCRIYLEKDYASQGKREAYLLGVIRNHQSGTERISQSESTGSSLLDAYYARNGA